MALFGRETERDQQRAVAWAQWFRAQNPYALASLVLGVFSLIEFGALLVFGIAGVVAGVVALVQLKRGAPSPAKEDDVVPPAAHAEPLAYAEHDLPGPIRAADYDAVERVEWREGGRLAWTGIVTSVLSLVIALLLYLRVFG